MFKYGIKAKSKKLLAFFIETIDLFKKMCYNMYRLKGERE